MMGGASPLYGRGTAAQNAIQVWMLRRADREVLCGDPRRSGPPTYPAASCETAERFAALSPKEREAWLEENYAELRAGKLKLEDLP